MHPLIDAHRREILDLAARYGVTDVRVFGSMARGDADGSSDVDLLVRPLPATSLFDLGGLLMDAQDLLGRPVNVVSEGALAPGIREWVLREALVL
jgi:predicted nucleotidyltransferase